MILLLLNMPQQDGGCQKEFPVLLGWILDSSPKNVIIRKNKNIFFINI